MGHLPVCFNKSPYTWGSTLRGGVGICTVEMTDALHTGSQQPNKLTQAMSKPKFTQAFNKQTKFTHRHSTSHQNLHTAVKNPINLHTGSQQPKKNTHRQSATQKVCIQVVNNPKGLHTGSHKPTN